MVAKLNSAEVESLSRRLRHGEKLTDTEFLILRRTYQEAQDYLFQQSEYEARAGAKIIFWAEGEADVLKQDEAALVERGRQLAMQYQIYLGMSIHMKNPSSNPLRQNKVVLVAPSGEIAWEYHKRHMVPGTGDGFSIRPGNGKLLWTDTPYGRIAAVICFDQDFHDIIRQMEHTGIDILFVPSHDWKDIASIRAKMAVFRTIEQGFSLVRPTSEGISLAVDGMGRILAAMNYSTTDNSSMSAFVPIRRAKTVYSKIGDVFAWICVTGFFLLAGIGLRKKRSGR
jgi:apolipoprotein N-acyltransferase